jgi:heme exporter protein A
LLSVSNLTFGYTATPLFKNLNFEIGGGILVHLKGMNGAGKSTLMALLAGLLQADQGVIRFANGIRKEYLPAEGSGHYLKLSAYDNLKFWLALHCKDLTVDELKQELSFWRLNPVILHNQIPVEQFSTGMKRKLALARVRLSGANLWLLDEPVSGLDDHALKQFTAMIKQHLGAGGSALIISHDTSPLADLVSTTLTIGEK